MEEGNGKIVKGWEWVENYSTVKIIRKLDRSKIIYSIEQYNTHIITSQLQRRPSGFIKALATLYPSCGSTQSSQYS